MRTISRCAAVLVLSVLSLAFSSSLLYAAPLSLSCANNVAEVGVAYSSALVASGGVAPYTFSIASGSLPPGLTLDPSTGAITGTPTSAGTAFNFHAQVVDSAGSTVTSKCAIKVVAHMEVNCPTNKAVVGQPYSSAVVFHGGVPPYTFSISAGSLPPGLTLNPSTGVISGTPTMGGTFNFTIQVVDSLGAVATRKCGITIPKPNITLACASSSGQVGVAYSSALVAMGGTPPYTFSIASGSLPPGLTLNASTGAITGTPTASGTFSFTAKVVDSTGSVAGTAAANCSIVVNPPPQITCLATGTTGEVGVPFSSGALTVTGGTAPYTFSVVGTLPAGLSLNTSTGAVTGTPTAAGSFSIAVTDALGETASTTCPYTIIPPPQLTCLATGTTGEVGAPFGSGALTVTGGTAPYTFSVVGTLPAGLTLNTSTGAVSGTPTAAGSFSIQVTDAKGVTATTTCPYTIIPGLQLTCLATGTTGEVGAPFSSGALTVTGGTAPYTFSVVGTLPTGLTLNTSTGAISGTPTAAGSFSIQVTDAKGVTATTTCPYTIVSGPQLTCLATGTTGEVGAPFSSGALTVTGGTAPYTFSIVGTLPAGLTLNTSTGAVTGTPTAAGSFSIQVTDAKGVTATTTCPYTIVSGPQLTCLATGTTGEVGAPFSSGALTITGGTAPFTFSVVGTLPAGLTLNASTGAVTGTPTAAGSFSIQVTDANGVTATTTCPYTIVPPPSVSCSSTNTSGEVGVPFNSGTITVTGGTAPYTYSIVGTLPAGLTLNTSTGVVTGTATASGTFSIQVTDALGVVGGSCPFTIIPGPQVTCSAVNTGTVGVPFDSGPITVTGGTPPYTFSISSGTLPPGLTLNTSTGEITGTPTAPGTFTIGVTDSLGATGTGCTITINPPACLSSGLGAASGFSVLGLEGANLNFSSGGTNVTGNVGVGVNGQLNFSGGGLVTGTLFADPTAQIQLSGGSKFTGVEVIQSMTAIQNAALAEATTLAALTPTQTFSSITNSTSFTGSGGQNVIQINGQVNLGGGSTLTITGGPTDTFIFNISGNFQLSGGSSIVLNGVSPNQVVWYLPGSGAGVTTTGNSKTAGVFLVPNGQIQISGGVHVSEFIAGQGITLHSAPTVKAFPPCGPGPLGLTCPASTGVVGVPYSSALVATGGQPPYVFSITAGSLPPLLTLDTSDGDITGTPTTANPYAFTAQVMDSSGLAAGTVSDNCTINVTTTNYVCVIPPSGTQIGGSGTSWNKFTPQGSGDVVWIHAHIGTPSGVPTNVVTTVQFTGVNFALNGQNYALPDGFLVFDPSAPATPTTSFNPAFAPNGAWTTTINPNNLSDEIFFTGQAVPVDSNISGGGTANLTYTTDSTDNNLAFSWQWSAAVYTFWPGNNAADIQPYHGNGLHAATPLNTQVQQSLIQGPRGGGGSNYTGSWSATGNGACPGSN